MEWESPKTKRSKTNSPKKNGYSPRDQKTKAAATKLICENEFGEVSEKIQNVINGISAEAARQPRRENESVKLERSGAGERPTVPRSPATFTGV